MLCLQVQVGVIGVASERDAAAFVEDKVLLNYVLDGYPVCSMQHGISAEHVETALVVV